MTEDTNLFKRQLMLGGLSRRDFLSRSMAAGMSLAAANTLLASPAFAQQPRKGGHLKLGLKGGSSTDALDPATYSVAVMYMTGKCWGDTLVETDPATGAALPGLAESWSSSPDAAVWTFKIRKDVRF